MRSIMHANRLHLLLPFALPAAADAATALHDIRSPALDRLIARATLVERVIGEDFQRTLPHERWIARQFGALSTDSGAAAAAADEAPLAPYMLRADGGQPGDATWACVQPVHVRIAHDHLVLIDPASLELSDEEASALLAVARPLIEELGVRIEAPKPTRWYLSGEGFGTLAGASPLRASGRNIEIWLPHEAHSGERSRAWMKLQNEVQMAWFQHPVNEAREARGLPAVNSIWFHAQGAARPVHSPFARVFSDAAATRGLAMTAGVQNAAPPASFGALIGKPGDADPASASSQSALVELDPFSAPFIEQDWARWNAQFAALEDDWFAPALAALESGALAELGLTLCGDTGSVTLAITRGDLRKFWRQRVLASLFIE
ncbi:MAG: Regulatory protein, RpfE type [uncultured Paraburkholderia sp.]|nr:MAG: Regulatory protein, RpfE type [uncultured Paraburkholderia sp.]CAH2791947.1 MAG: Regulatory protein, RpfE type [uncultured Paraburkholderia sp.]CAH2892663.1 MAG: Regulatory protein, RpfE type [uncultured Paraburkholderia sp.]CAH2911794.1 MAG: Regulatory protein, RpfE type [uncultured Paraburkholderia sp.]CAH2928298.1 MAG: Regulatory protein, RpfE type [uncultured Paraburkholderia sp.]